VIFFSEIKITKLLIREFFFFSNTNLDRLEI